MADRAPLDLHTLTDAQRDGAACARCGRLDGAMADVDDDLPPGLAGRLVEHLPACPGDDMRDPHDRLDEVDDADLLDELDARDSDDGYGLDHYRGRRSPRPRYVDDEPGVVATLVGGVAALAAVAVMFSTAIAVLVIVTRSTTAQLVVATIAAAVAVGWLVEVAGRTRHRLHQRRR